MKKVISVALLLVMVLTVFAGCSNPQKEIVGTWTGETSVLGGVVTEKTFTFYEDGTGKTETFLGVEIEISYTIDDETLTVTTSALGVANDTVYTYTLEDDVLTLVDGDTTYRLFKEEA
ncbi:MAG: hypothetical protein IJE93_05580 [Clostridia bacterium]|nr:hypothetical protein [Clostridia bacterium]